MISVWQFRRFWRLSVLGAAVTGLAGCAVMGPDYVRPATIQPPPAWSAPLLPHDGSPQAMTDWWRTFWEAGGDHTGFPALLATTLEHNTALESAQGAIDAARATVTMRGGLSPLQGSVGGTLLRSGNPPNPAVPTQTSRSVAVDASWEIDLFGRVRRNAEAAGARLAARTADWHAMRVTLAAEVATLYNEWRGCVRVARSMVQDVASRQQTATITYGAVAAGWRAPAEQELATASLADARSQLTAQQASCDRIVNGLATLTGKLSSTEVRQHLVEPEQTAAPHVVPFSVTTLPAQLLAQRADLASAEQELVAASAEIGVAEAERYPRLSLLGNLGVGVSDLAGGKTVDQRPWGLGPALSLPLLSATLTDAQVQAATARYRMAQAGYRRALLNAVQEVENSMVNLASTRQRAADARAAAEGYARFLATSTSHWQQGGISLLTLEETRRIAMSAERAMIQQQHQEIQQWINLYKALGGGWQESAS
jgi:NodT family efflux transporter outer membrane factor (OMF) lipoprotein